MTDEALLPASEEIKALFDRIAPVYDQLNQGLSLGQHRIWKLMAVKWSQPQKSDRALDVCCGSGDLAQLLAHQVGASGRVFGLDFSPEQLMVARQRASSQYPPLAIEWIEGDALNLPFDDNTFDCATMGYGLRNVIDIPRCLAELQRVLKPKAKVAILDFHRPSQPWIRTLQRWYLQTVVVPTAQRFGLTDEYAYISPSLDRFPTGSEQVKLAYQAGFSQAIHYPISGGIMGVLVSKK